MASMVSFASNAAEVDAADPMTSLGDLIGPDDDQTTASVAGGCTCHDEPASDLPELDARTIPHAIRHGAIIGALDGIGAGHGLVLVAPHDPVPLLQQIQQRFDGRFEVAYLERGPVAWRLRFTRGDD
jgi:uncharacterized protein (DUF2249 family)